MKQWIMMVLVSMFFVGCFFDTDEKEIEKQLSSSSVVVSSSSNVVPKVGTKLVMTKNTNLKKIVIGDPENKVVALDSSNGYDIVTVKWGRLDAKEYNFDYYLKSTNEDIILDSITFSDTSFKVKSNTSVKGMVISKDIGFTGDGKITVNYNNMLFRNSKLDSVVTMYVYGRNSVTDSLEKLEVKFQVENPMVVMSYVHDSKIGYYENINFSIKNYTNKVLTLDIQDSTYLVNPNDSVSVFTSFDYGQYNYNCKFENKTWFEYENGKMTDDGFILYQTMETKEYTIENNGDTTMRQSIRY
jgi:hypothetical protein